MQKKKKRTQEGGKHFVPLQMFVSWKRSGGTGKQGCVPSVLVFFSQPMLVNHEMHKKNVLFSLERLFRIGALFFISLLRFRAAPATGLFWCV